MSFHSDCSSEMEKKEVKKNIWVEKNNILIK